MSLDDLECTTPFQFFELETMFKKQLASGKIPAEFNTGLTEEELNSKDNVERFRLMLKWNAKLQFDNGNLQLCDIKRINGAKNVPDNKSHLKDIFESVMTSYVLSDTYKSYIDMYKTTREVKNMTQWKAEAKALREQSKRDERTILILKDTIQNLKVDRAVNEKKNPRKKNVRKPSGFVKPTLISDELAAFFKKDKGTMMARTEVTQELQKYIKAWGLQDKENGRIIRYDDTLKELLKIPDGDELTYFNLQKYISLHFSIL